MYRYLLTKEHFTDSVEWCYRACLFTVEPDGAEEIWDIMKMDTEGALDEFIERTYGVMPPPVDGKVAFNSTNDGMP